MAAARADDYLGYLRRTGLRDYRGTAGNRGVYVLRRIDGGEEHFVVVSLWESLGAVQTFAGDDLETARYYPDDKGYLLELEPYVAHYEVVWSPESAAT